MMKGCDVEITIVKLKLRNAQRLKAKWKQDQDWNKQTHIKNQLLPIDALYKW